MTPKLNRRLVLEERQGGSDGAGGRTSSWQELGTHWAELTPARGRFERGEGVARSRVPYRVILRAMPQDAPSRPEPGQRFVEGSRIFAIRAVRDLDTDARYLVCAVDEEVIT